MKENRKESKPGPDGRMCTMGLCWRESQVASVSPETHCSPALRAQWKSWSASKNNYTLRVTCCKNTGSSSLPDASHYGQ